MPACNLSALIKKPSGTCQSYIPAGVSERVYLFNIDDMFASGYPEPDNSGFIDAAKINTTELYALDIKTDSGQVTSEKSEDNQSRSLVFTGVVDHSIDKFLAIDGAIGNGMNVGVIVPIDDSKSYIIYSPYRNTKYSSNYDSGTTYDSDHGFTITFTASPVLFGCPMVAIGKSRLQSDAIKNYDSNIYAGSSSDTTSNMVLAKSKMYIVKGSSESMTVTTANDLAIQAASSSDTEVATVGTMTHTTDATTKVRTTTIPVTGVGEGDAYIKLVDNNNGTATFNVSVANAD